MPTAFAGFSTMEKSQKIDSFATPATTADA
jgi:hypothetical protein